MKAKLDTIAAYQTPEGVELSLSFAGPLARGLAWLIDLGVRVVLYIVLSLVLYWAGGVGKGLILVSLFMIEWFYPVVFEIRSGMTPGKRAMGLQVIHDDGTPVSWSSSLLRNLLRAVDILPLFYVIGLTSMNLNANFKRLGDLAAGTLVVYNNDSNLVFSIPKFPPQPPPMPLKIEEQRLVLDFCERADRLSPERRKELAGLLPSLIGNNDQENRLLSYGNWFLKGKSHDESKSV